MSDAEKAVLLAMRAALQDKKGLSADQRLFLSDVSWLLFAGSFADEDSFTKAIKLIAQMEDAGMETRSEAVGKFLDGILKIAGY